MNLVKWLGLEAWKQQVLDDIAAAKEEAIQEVATEWLDKHVHKLRPGSLYIVQVAENTSKESCDAMRHAIEAQGAYCIIVAADTMRVVSFSARA